MPVLRWVSYHSLFPHVHNRKGLTIVADQEFLASFAVEIDEAGVARLQKILADNKALADNVSAAFQAAAKAMKEFAGMLPTLFSDCRADPGAKGKRSPGC